MAISAGQSGTVIIFSWLCGYTIWSAVGIILSSVCSSVCLSVKLCILALRVGMQGWKLYQRVPSRHVPICPFRHFCWRMYRLATKRTAKKQVVENASVSFFTTMRVLVYSDYLLLTCRALS